MTSLNIIACVTILISVSYSTAEIKCGPNETAEDCPRICSYDFCPTHELHDKAPCPKPTTCPPPACKCNFNYRRAVNGTCIPTEECPPFECRRSNEIFLPCPSYCPGDDCSNANPTGECPFLTLLVVNCSPSCRCIPHYWRRDGKCVPYLECPGVEKYLKGNVQKNKPLHLRPLIIRSSTPANEIIFDLNWNTN